MEAATEFYHEDALARVGMTSCKSVVTPGVKRGAPAPESREARLLSIEARVSFEGLLLSIEAVCQRNSMFLTHFASVDCVNSDSCSEVTIQSCHVFFCAARDDRRLVVESLLCVFSIRSLLSDLES